MSAFRERYASLYAKLGFPLSESDGLAESTLAAAERRLGLTLPEALRDYYALAGAERKLNRAHNQLAGPDELELVVDRLVFLSENQGVVVWAADVADPALADPPVVQGSGEPGEWYPEHPSCAQFLEVMLHWQAVMGSALPVAGSHQVSSRIPSFQGALDESYGCVGEVSGLRAYNWNGVALCLVPWDAGRRLFVAARSEAELEAATRRVGLSWDRDFDQA